MRTQVTIGMLFLYFLTYSQPGTVSEHLKIDQFGYPKNARKICVVNNPQEGFDYDAGDFYTPGGSFHLKKPARPSIYINLH